MAWNRTTKAIVLGILALLLVLAATIVFLKRRDIADWLNVAAGERAVADHTVTPIDLTAHYGTPVAALENSSSYWGDIPWGFQVFDHVPLQIDGLMELWGAGNSKMGNDFPEERLGIPVNRTFETLYVYHCTYFSSPKNTPVYDLVFRYTDGSSMTNEFLYGIDLLDFNSGRGKTVKAPTGKNTVLAWVGASFTEDGKQPLRFMLTAVTNPQPALKVATIDLFSCKNQSAGVILAMTTGKAGLMK